MTHSCTFLSGLSTPYQCACCHAQPQSTIILEACIHLHLPHLDQTTVEMSSIEEFFHASSVALNLSR